MSELEQLPDHLRRPHMRPYQPLGVQKDGQQLVVLRDPAMLQTQSMVVQPQALAVMQHFNGDRSLEEIIAALQIREPDHINALINLVQKLDEMGLVWGPTFERLERELKATLLERGAFPNGTEGAETQGADALRAQLQAWLDETEDPEVEGTPVAILAPHLDYGRGWPNYAVAYRCLTDVPTPDRVLVLGTNHFGIGDGVVLTELGFDTPMGRCDADRPMVNAFRGKLGNDAFIDQLDHHGEHSIRLQLPWLQHRFGDVPIVAALIPDPFSQMIDDGGSRVSVDAFIAAATEILESVGGRTLVVSSADLSHVGPQFGEPRKVDDQRKRDVERQDRDLMGHYLSADPAAFLSAVQWCRNPTRWCSVGNMYAAMRLTQPTAVELLDYRQASDDQGMALISSAAMALLKD